MENHGRLASLSTTGSDATLPTAGSLSSASCNPHSCLYASFVLRGACCLSSTPRCRIGVDGTKSRLIKPRNMHVLLQNDGATVCLTASSTAVCPSALRSPRILFQLKVRKTIGERVITKTIVDRLAVSGPIGM